VVIFHSGISAAAIVAVVLNLLFNVLLPGAPAQPSIVAAGPTVGVPGGERVVQESDGAGAPSATAARGARTSA
ncbi:purine permease, partial [Tsukamurella tyrosinosolvens]